MENQQREDEQEVLARRLYNLNVLAFVVVCCFLFFEAVVNQLINEYAVVFFIVFLTLFKVLASKRKFTLAWCTVGLAVGLLLALKLIQ